MFPDTRAVDTKQTDTPRVRLHHAHLVLKIVEFSAKVSDLRPEPGRLLLAVNGVHRAPRRSRPKLLHLHSNITSGQSITRHKAASPPHTDGSVVFTTWRQCASPSNTWFLGHIKVRNPSGISIGSAVFCTADGRKCLYLQRAARFSSTLSLRMGDLAPI